MEQVNNPIKIAYDAVSILVEKGYNAGTILSSDDISVVIKLDEKMFQTKICQELANMGAEWVAGKIEEYFTRMN